MNRRSLRPTAWIRLFLVLALLAASCADNTTETAPTTVEAPRTLPAVPTLASSTAVLESTTPSSLPLVDELGLPIADAMIDTRPGQLSLSAAEFIVLDLGDTAATDPRQIMVADTPVGTMGYYAWTNTSGEPCVGFVEPSLSSWGCGDALPADPAQHLSSLRLGAAWGDQRYAVTPDPLPSTVLAIDVVTANGYRLRTFPVEGYAVLADNLNNGLPVEVVVYFVDGTELSQATNFVLDGPS